MTQKNRTLGFFLIALGLMLILGYYNVMDFDLFDFWPLILLYLGVKSERDYFNGYGGSNKLMTGAVLITYSLYFLADQFIPYQFTNILWPMFILGPALGFLQMGYYGHSRKKNHRVGIILTTISGIFFFNELVDLRFDLILYVGLIMIGFFMLRKDQEDDLDDDKEDSENDDRYPGEKY